MRKIVYLILLAILLIPATSNSVEASFVSDRNYRHELRKENNQNIKLIKEFFKQHNKYANTHDVNNLEKLYTDSYINNDGFDKKVYFKSIEETWQSCPDITYTIKIKSININGDYADVNVEETATGTINERIENDKTIAGELHSLAEGIYHMIRINGKWYINAETALTDESSLLYGDARFMEIELQAPNQVSAGETYTVSLKVDTDENTVVVGSIDHDPVTYPTNTPKSELRTINKSSQMLERFIKANSDNINEYAVASLAISKMQPIGTSYRIYMAGLACVMRRVNVIPKNNFINIEEDK